MLKESFIFIIGDRKNERKIYPRLTKKCSDPTPFIEFAIPALKMSRLLREANLLKM